MAQQVRAARLLLILLTFCLLAPVGQVGQAAGEKAEGASPRLAKVVYITASQACACTLKRCQAADPVVKELFQGPRQKLLTTLDYARDKAAVAPYVRDHHIFALPALLFLDGEGKLLWSAVGQLSKEDILSKLGQYGG